MIPRGQILDADDAENVYRQGFAKLVFVTGPALHVRSEDAEVVCAARRAGERFVERVTTVWGAVLRDLDVSQVLGVLVETPESIARDAAYEEWRDTVRRERYPSWQDGTE